MNLRDKYIKKAVRFLKEKNEYKKEVVTEMIYGIDLDKDLPHMYYIGNTLRSEYLKTIKTELIDDILSILGSRLDKINFDTFIFHSTCYYDKKEYISYLVKNFYVESGMIALDRYLYGNTSNDEYVSSIRLLKNNFCLKV